MKDRIEQILKVKNLTATKFAEELDVQRSGISHILSGRNNPSLDFILRIKETYPEFNLDWLLLGEGPMTTSKQKPGSVKPLDYNLFDDLESELEKRAKAIEDVPATDVQKIKQIGPEEPSLAQPGKKEAPTPGLAGFGAMNFSKNVERVVVFYTDKTFDAYLPG